VQRTAAPVVYRALQAAQGVFDGGATDREAIVAKAHRVLASEPLVHQVQYVSLADTSGREVDVAVKGCMLSTAVTLKSDTPGKTSVRLIDNVVM
jgi:pantothenate synthetase